MELLYRVIIKTLIMSVAYLKNSYVIVTITMLQKAADVVSTVPMSHFRKRHKDYFFL